MILTPRLSNSGLIRAMYPSSVVQTGVKSLGWEKSTVQEPPIHLWKSIGPSVVWAVKLGASSPIRNDMGTALLCVGRVTLTPCRPRRQGVYFATGRAVASAGG